MIQLSERSRRVAPSITLAVTAKAKALLQQGIDVVSFGAGEPDFDTPDFIKVAAKQSLDDGLTKYTPAGGTPALKKAIADKFAADNKLSYTPAQVTTGPGGKGCLYLAMQAILNDGDDVLIPAPYWVSYPEMAKLAGAVPRFVVGAESAGFNITPEQLEAALTDKTRLLILNSPGNPAGNAYTPAELAALAQVVAKYPNLVVFSDEIYEKLIYDGFTHVSFATLHPSLPERTLTFNCHSKTYSMTGWRVGYVGGPEHVIGCINKLQSQLNSHITSFTQPAATLALTDPAGPPEMETMRAKFEQRMHHMHRRLNELPGVTCVKPQGAFYCFPNISAHLRPGETSIQFAERLLDEAHVAVVPGDDSGFPTHVRLSFATGMAQIDKGLDRMAEYLARG